MLVVCSPDTAVTLLEPSAIAIGPLAPLIQLTVNDFLWVAGFIIADFKLRLLTVTDANILHRPLVLKRLRKKPAEVYMMVMVFAVEGSAALAMKLQVIGEESAMAITVMGEADAFFAARVVPCEEAVAVRAAQATLIEHLADRFARVRPVVAKAFAVIK
jgi:hypothetical protein